jgi:sulfite exporter TauE/SafE
MLLVALYTSGLASVVRRLESAGAFVWRYLQPCSRWLLPANTLPRALGLGALWGWLPCGMVYGVLLTALATGDALEGALVMLAFGAGTLPNVLGIALLARRVRGLLTQRGTRYAAACVAAGVALLAFWTALHPAPGGDALCRIPLLR